MKKENLDSLVLVNPTGMPDVESAKFSKTRIGIENESYRIWQT
jgi:hypothetical protein